MILLGILIGVIAGGILVFIIQNSLLKNKSDIIELREWHPRIKDTSNLFF